MCIISLCIYLFQEYPFFTMKSFPPGFIVHLGGVVSARSVKLLDRIHNPGKLHLSHSLNMLEMRIWDAARLMNFSCHRPFECMLRTTEVWFCASRWARDQGCMVDRAKDRDSLPHQSHGLSCCPWLQRANKYLVRELLKPLCRSDVLFAA